MQFRYAMFYMQGMRDDSIWKNLALAFGDGIAFGVGVKISQDATARMAPQRSNVQELSARLAEIETRIDRARQSNALPGQFNQKVVEAVISVVDARLRDQANQFERRLSEEMAALRGDFSEQLAATRKHAADENQLLRTQVTAVHREFAQSVAQLVDEQIGAAMDARLEPVERGLRQEVGNQAERIAGLAAAAADQHIAGRMQPVESAVSSLSQRLEENDRNTLELVLALGQLCLQTAERLSAPAVEMIAEAPPIPPMARAAAETAPRNTTDPTPQPEPEAIAPAAEQAKALWRIPLVSSFFVAAGGLLLLHYL